MYLNAVHSIVFRDQNDDMYMQLVLFLCQLGQRWTSSAINRSSTIWKIYFENVSVGCTIQWSIEAFTIIRSAYLTTSG